MISSVLSITKLSSSNDNDAYNLQLDYVYEGPILATHVLQIEEQINDSLWLILGTAHLAKEGTVQITDILVPGPRLIRISVTKYQPRKTVLYCSTPVPLTITPTRITRPSVNSDSESAVVVVATNNGWDFIEICIRALLTDIRTEQLLVVDTGSKEDYLAYLRKLQQRYQ